MKKINTKIGQVCRLALPYVITVILPIVSVFCLSNMIINSYQERMVADKQRSIELAFERFLQKTETIEKVSYIIGQSDVMTAYVYNSLRKPGHSVPEYMEVRDFLNNFLINNDVGFLYFYDIAGSNVITNDAAFSDAVQFFRYKYQIDGYTPKESLERALEFTTDNGYSPAMTVKIAGKAHTQVIEYRISVPINQISRNPSQLVLVMAVEDLFADFYDVLGADGAFYVYDFKDQLIFATGEATEDIAQLSPGLGLRPVSEGELLGYEMVCISDSMDWKVQFCVPLLSEADQAGNLSPSIWLMVVLPVLASVLLCIYFTHKHHRDILNIIELFKGQDREQEKAGTDAVYPEEVSYRMIRAYADKVITENNRYKECIVGYEDSRKYAVLDQLLRNTYSSSEEMANSLKELKWHIPDNQCAVLCLRYDGASYRTFVAENITIKDFVKEFLTGTIERKVEIFDTSAKETICLIPLKDDENMEVVVRDLISRLNVEIGYNFGIEIRAGAGSVVDSIMEISKSYHQAKAVIRYSETSGNKLLLYSELERMEDIYYYPQETDEKIYNYVVVGNVEEAKKIIQKVYRENFENRGEILPDRVAELVKSKIREAIAALAGKYHIMIEAVLSELKEEPDTQFYFDKMCDLVESIAEEIGEKKQAVQSTSVLKIYDYVTENYCDNTLSLKQISHVFGFHENYVSNLFKTVYGENLSAFIERLRMEKACDLIKNTDRKISDIAEETGYTSAESFRRAFKKMTGVTPGEYREQ